MMWTARNWLALGAMSLLLVGPDARGQNPVARAHFETARDHVAAMDYDLAAKELDAVTGSPAIERDVLQLRAQVALGRGDYDEAARVMALPSAQGDEAGRYLAEIVRGSARASAQTFVHVDQAQGIEVRLQDGNDEALVPLIVETVVKARAHLSSTLAVDWPKPTRIFVVRDHLTLAATTGLPYEAARTTGTVAVAKWGRVTMLTPRAPQHGYAWRDTLAHELTHVAITRKSADRAPLWLQEGLAKRQETRWRTPGPFDERPSPDAIVTRGIEMKLDLPLDNLGPSLAMLPSPQTALVAYSEVASFLGFLVSHSGDGFLPKFLTALRSEKGNVDAALKSATNDGMKVWEGRWREYLAHKPHEPLPKEMGLLPPSPADKPVVKAGEQPPARQLRDRMRRAELLLGREHYAEAKKELDVVLAFGQNDPRYRALRARTFELMQRAEEAKAALGDPKELFVSYGPFWAVRGRLQVADPAWSPGANAYDEGLSVDPLDVEIACRVAEQSVTDTMTKNTPTAALCDTALARKEPRVGRE